ncbi:hypothetical protein OUZ56_008520 [Daphnia magna]|uniref:Uncharacterized protein n=1 Tax=Daphnia magna TaxID=35525 RepID=A0ABR0AD81_9CRUS|nr:hypothetical protein OUZ56_008520 [Daphnia magna]
MFKPRSSIDIGILYTDFESYGQFKDSQFFLSLLDLLAGLTSSQDERFDIRLYFRGTDDLRANLTTTHEGNVKNWKKPHHVFDNEEKNRSCDKVNDSRQQRTYDSFWTRLHT